MARKSAPLASNDFAYKGYLKPDPRPHILALIDVALYNIGRRHDGDDKRLIIAEESLEEAKALIAAYAQCALPLRLPLTTNNHAEALLAIVDAAASAEIPEVS